MSHTHLSILVTAPHNTAMPGPLQTQHKGTVYGDDEYAPQNRDSARRCAPQTAARPPADLKQPSPPGHDSFARQTGASRDGVRMRGAPFMLTQLPRRSCPRSSPS